MIEILNISARNFYSIGQVTQTVKFENGETTLVLGQNVDYGDNIRNGVGKAQPLYSKVKVPNGWKSFKDINVGDTVCTPEGTQTLVVGKYPQGKKDIYEIVMSDGRKTRACNEHLWEVLYEDGTRKVVDTKQIKEDLDNGVKVYIEALESTYEKDVRLVVDPYLMGVILLNGEVENNRLRFINLDSRIRETIVERLNNEYVFEQNGPFSYLVPKYHDYVFDFVKENGIHNVPNVPDIYQRSSFEQRTELVKGFMDSKAEQDESIARIYLPTGQDTFAKELQEIFWSVGALCKLKFASYTIKDVNKGLVDSDKDIILSIKFKNANKFFTLEEKADYPMFKKLFYSVKKINYVSHEEAACIKVLDSNALYLTDGYITTHNTTIINALSYGLFGKPITNVKQDNMINHINGKRMLVTIDFKANDVFYRIERGRKPNVLKFIKYDGDNEVDMMDPEDESGGDSSNKAQGANADTQKQIEKILGISNLLFKHIIAMNTYATSFMASKASEQRDIIEEILGITVLSQKADKLSEMIKETKKEIEKEEIRIETLVEANERTKRTLENLYIKKDSWETERKNTIKELKDAIKQLNEIDIDEELKNHEHNDSVRQTRSQVESLKRELQSVEKLRDNNVRSLTDLGKQLESFENNTCPTCKQKVEGEEHKQHKEKLEKQISELLTSVDEQEATIKEYKEVLDKVELDDEKPVFYKNIADAYNHKSTIENFGEKIKEKEEAVNPYLEQIEDMETSGNGVQDIDYTNLRNLESDMKHQKFLQKMLTNRDSFVRKRIIDYSLPYLNKRLAEYLERLRLPHKVEFDPTLTFSISDMGRSMDFDNLSRGEQNRTILALNMAFRDLYENLVGPINIMFVDELLDFGMDTSGALEGLKILKTLATERQKSVYMVTHKEELREYVENVIKVTKENGFTTYENEND